MFEFETGEGMDGSGRAVFVLFVHNLKTSERGMHKFTTEAERTHFQRWAFITE